MHSFFCDYLLTVKHMKYMNVPFFENFTPICSFLLGFKVGRYVVMSPMGKDWYYDLHAGHCFVLLSLARLAL